VCVCLCEVRASDKRITCDEEFSDSEDEGEGGRRHQDSYKHKRIRLDDKTADAGGKTAAAPPPPAEKSLYCTPSVVCVVVSLDRLVPPSINTHTHTRLTALCQGLPGLAGTRKVKPIWILLKQETVSGSGINWAIFKSAPSDR